MTTSLTVATFNANSIRARLPIILAWLADHSPDLLCIQETKVQDIDFPAAEIRASGYHVAFRGQKAHAGVAIISRLPLEEVSFGFGEESQEDEARLISGSVGGVSIVNSYVPQGRSPDSEHFALKLNWLRRLRELFAARHAPEQPVVWVGDFNVAPLPHDVYDPVKLANEVDFHPDVRAALQHVAEWGWVDIFRLHHPEAVDYSYYDYRIPKALERKLGWRIDHIWATPPLAACSTACWIDLEPRRADRPSDHTFVVARFELPESVEPVP